jgi:NAD+ kinase
MTSTIASTTHSPRSIRRATIVTHGHVDAIGPALERLQPVAAAQGVDLRFPADERQKHHLAARDGDPADTDIVVVLGGDGTMLRTLARFLGTGVPVLGVNFGRVGFLTSLRPDELEQGLARVFAGDYVVVELPTLEAEVQDKRFLALNDVVATSGMIGRMIELEWAIGGEDLGSVACDGLICATPSGSTAYNLSNGGPVLVRGLEAMAVTFVAPHSLHARPLVVPRGLDVTVWNRTDTVDAQVIADGHASATIGRDEQVRIRLGDERSLLATLPETTFFRRYRETFSS